VDRRDFLKTAGICAVSFITGGCLDHSRAEGLASIGGGKARPNIILLMADDLGYGDVGFNGNKIIRTPNLDAMASESLRFTRFYAAGPVCSPTRGTCLTGRHYFRYGIFSASVGYLPEEEITLASICRKKGYATGHFGKWHLASITKQGPTMPEYKENRLRKYGPPWERGYDESFVTECNVATWNPYQNEGMKWVFQLPFLHNGRVETRNVSGASSRIVMDRAIPFIEKAVEDERPFFTTIWFHEPHEPVVAGPKYRAMYSQYDQGQQHYYGCITAMDEQIGRLRAKLRRLGIEKNTIIWFCSDNGPEGMDSIGSTRWCRNSRGVTGGLRGRKRSLFNGGVMVPALFEWPEHVDGGRDIDVYCSTLDFLPTINEIIGYEMPDERPIDGMSLVRVLRGQQKRRDKAMGFIFVKPSKKAMHGSPTIGIVDGRWKFLTNFSELGNEDMLFDLSVDIEEKENVVGKYPKRSAKMKAEVRQWVRSLKKSHSGKDYPTDYQPVNSFPQLRGDWRG